MLRDLEAGELKYKSEEQNVFRFGGRRSGVFMRRWAFSIYLQLLKYVVDPPSVQAIMEIRVYNIAVGLGGVWKVFLVNWHK